MPVPTHNPECKTIIYKTICWDCKKAVWYFACSCGSIVLFDSKGWPWPEHKDSCSIYRIKHLWKSGWSFARIKRKIELASREYNQPIPPEVKDYLSRFEQAIEGRSEIIIDLLPTEEPIQFAGKILKIDSVNFYNRFGFPQSSISTALLGDLVTEL